MGEVQVITRAVRKGQWVGEGEIQVITRAVRKGAVGEERRNSGHS